MRIRHGTISGQLRAPLERQHIITLRHAGSFEYEENSFWKGPLESVDRSKWQMVRDRLAQFSHDYDQAIDDFKDELIQIRSEHKPRGLFSAKLDIVQLQMLFAGILPSTSFEEFIEACFSLFWESVEWSLESVRSYVDTDLKTQLTDVFLNLEKDIVAIGFAEHTADLDRAIRTALTDTQYALGRVRDWFQVPKGIEETPLTVEDVVATGMATVQGLHSTFVPRVTYEFKDNPTFYLGSITLIDILFIVIANIQKHSGLDAPEVSVEVHVDDDRLCIRVESAIRDGVWTHDMERQIEAIKKLIRSDDYQGAVSTEGRSGFFKLRRLLGPEAKSSSILDFGFLDHYRFFVDLRMRILGAGNGSSPG